MLISALLAALCRIWDFRADVEYFESPSSPAVSVVQIMPPPHWDQSIFTVDCEWTKPIFERPCGWVGARASEQLDAAIALANANGGGVVYLPRGQYYVDGPIVVPEGVVIKGEGTQVLGLGLAGLLLRSCSLCCLWYRVHTNPLCCPYLRSVSCC